MSGTSHPGHSSPLLTRSQGPSCSRRRFGAGIGHLALGGLGVAAMPLLAGATQIDATPPAAPIPKLSSDPSESPATVAARLGFDASAIFRFVADEIHFESYAGILRGARGTLRARAGNAADQAALLGALLEESQILFRFAIAPLPAESSGALTGLLAVPVEDLRSRAQAAASAAVLHGEGLNELPATPPPLSTQEETFLREQEELADRLLADGDRMARTVLPMITGALATAGIDLPVPASPALTAWESAQHVWVQVADGPRWIDLDPSLPGTAWGVAVAEPVASYAVVPEEWQHRLTIRISADENFGGYPVRRDVVSVSIASEQAVDTPIGISLAPAEGLGALGTGITQLFTSQQTIYPSIMVGSDLVESLSPMVFATSGASAVGVLDDTTAIEGAGEGETVAVWLAVDITIPDAAPVTVERALLDRVAAEDRAAGIFDVTRISQITVGSTILGEESIDAFDALTVLQVECATAPGYRLVPTLRDGSLFGPLEAFGTGMGAIRHALALGYEAGEGSWSYPTAPNVTAVTFVARGAGGAVEVSTDLLYRQRATAAFPGASPGETHPGVLSGVLDALAEDLLLAPARPSPGHAPGTSPPPPTIAQVFRQAGEEGIGIVALSTVDEIGRLTLDVTSAAAITAALGAGSIVVVPVQPVMLAGGATTGWWIIDPLTGQTRDMLGNGKAFASVAIPLAGLRLNAQDTLAWYARWAQYVAENVEFFACLGITLGLIALIVETRILFAGGPGGQAASAITGSLSIFGAASLTLC